MGLNPMRDDTLEHKTIGRVLAERAARIPERPFLIWQGQKTNYGEVEAITNRYANGFSAHGIRHGDHVAVMLPNCPEFLWVIWGLGKIGAVAVPLNTAVKGELLRYFLDQSDASLREYLGAQGMKKGDLSRFVEEAVRPVPCGRA